MGRITTVLLIALFAISCNNTANHNQYIDDETIELNNGEKWKVNVEMTPYILEGEKILIENDNSDYKMLAKQLKDKNNGLIESCTMNGKGHDELHKWLLPHMDLVKALDNAENQQNSESIIMQLKESFNTYNTYFQ